MKPQPFSELEFRHISITTKEGEINGLFSDLRLDYDTIPKGLIPYGLRHRDDDDAELSTIETHVCVNYFGVLLVNEPLIFGDADYIAALDWGFCDGASDYPEWARKYLGDE